MRSTEEVFGLTVKVSDAFRGTPVVIPVGWESATEIQESWEKAFHAMLQNTVMLFVLPFDATGMILVVELSSSGAKRARIAGFVALRVPSVVRVSPVGDCATKMG